MKKLASRKDTRVIDLLIAHGPLGYGIYALLVEYLKERKAFRSIDDIARIAYELHADVETVRSVIEDFGLFTIDADKNISASGGKVPAAVKPICDSLSEETDDLCEESVAETEDRPEPSVAEPVFTSAVSLLTSSQKRRERRRRLRGYHL